MNGGPVCCTDCNTPLPESYYNAAEPERCPGCNSLVAVTVFPALFKPLAAGHSGERILVDGEAGCFFHPQKRAAVPCSVCGRFLCALCDVELNGEHLCPTCLETGQKKGRLTHLETRRTLYDSAALTLALLPLIMWPVTLLTAPAAVGLGVYAWSKPSSIVARTRLRSLFAIAIGLIQIAGWGILIYKLATR